MPRKDDEYWQEVAESRGFDHERQMLKYYRNTEVWNLADIAESFGVPIWTIKERLERWDVR